MNSILTLAELFPNPVQVDAIARMHLASYESKMVLDMLFEYLDFVHANFLSNEAKGTTNIDFNLSLDNPNDSNLTCSMSRVLYPFLAKCKADQDPLIPAPITTASTILKIFYKTKR